MKRILLLIACVFSLEGIARVPVQQVVSYNDQFALSLYKAVMKPQQSFVVAPYSLSSAFAIVYLGSAGETQREIATFFRFPLAPNYLAQSFQSINEGLSSDKNLKLASSLWIERTINVNDTFRTNVDQNFPNQFFEVDFLLRTDSARNDINSWGAKVTDKKIPSILNVSDVSNSTKMLVVATCSLSSPWQKPFNVRETKSEPFFYTKQNQRTVTMMRALNEFPYYEDEQVKIVELPYSQDQSQGARLSLFVVVPKEVDGLKRLEDDLGPETFSLWISDIQTRLVDVKIPRFRNTQVYSFKEIFDKMGFKGPFQSGADFSELTSSSGVYVSKVIQKVSFSIDERGTDTSVPNTSQKQLAQNPEGIKTVVADRPFLYFVFDNTINQIVLIGRCLQP